MLKAGRGGKDQQNSSGNTSGGYSLVEGGRQEGRYDRVSVGGAETNSQERARTSQKLSQRGSKCGVKDLLKVKRIRAENKSGQSKSGAAEAVGENWTAVSSSFSTGGPDPIRIRLRSLPGQ